jgi:hypothetical protein
MRYQSFIDVDKEYDNQLAIYIDMLNASGFIQQTTPFEEIEHNIVSLKKIEDKFKARIHQLLSENIFKTYSTDDIRDNFNEYLSKDWVYFTQPEYDNEALRVMFTSINNYHSFFSTLYFNKKRELLEYKAEVEKK